MSDDHRDRPAILEHDDPRHIVTLPDGSVDRWYALGGSGGDRFESADAFADRLAAGDRTFSLEPTAVRPGGQAVNAARQVHALGDRPTLIGHLDHPVFPDFPFEMRSMGPPATVRVVDVGGEELQLAEPGPAEDWGLAELLAVVDWDRLVGADALCCTNWVSVRGLTAVFDRLAATPPADPLPIVVDPGPIETVDPAALEGLFDVLSRADRADDSLAVVLSVNPTEFRAAARVVDVDAEPTADSLAALRAALDLTGVVSHGPDAAIGATRTETAVAEMYDVGDPRRTTGAGDRFSAGLTCALARGRGLEPALSLGNACAAHFVETGDTADPAAVRALRED
ncbi:PfkB domain-containing protein [Natrinema thermotolerans DSM 11552]|nr:PfkB domain-containing protein [Natrinema thermotolerans DSM 11552]